jgi:hypothetical protein
MVTWAMRTPKKSDKASENYTSLNLSPLTSAAVPVSMLHSGQLLALTPDSEGGLLLRKGFYADVVTPGAAVGGCFDLACKAIYVIGRIQFYVPQSQGDRAIAFRTRITQSEQLQEIVDEVAPLRRAHRMIHHLAKEFGSQEMKKIPPEWIAQLAGVNPTTVKLWWQHYTSASQPKTALPV